jgi:hypothetical protein
VLLLFFGYGWEVVLTANRIPGSMALAAGLGMLLAVSRATLAGDLLAAGLLTLSLASHPTGIAFAVGAAVLVLARPSPWRWRSAWVFAGPSLLYAAWWLFLRPGDTQPTQTRISELAHFLGQSWTEATASVSGLAGVLHGPAYDHALGWGAGALLLGLVLAGIATSWRRLPPQFWAVAAALFTLCITTALTRGNVFLILFRPADSPRYLYPEAILLLLLLVELAGAVRLPSWATAIAMGVLALGLVANIDRLEAAGSESRRASDGVRAAYGATEISSKPVPTNYNPLSASYPTADQYLTIAERFGSLGYSAAELRTRPADVRSVADRTLLRAEGIQPRAEASPDPRYPFPPPLATSLRGTMRDDHGCLRLQPRDGAALAEIVLPPGSGIRIAARRLGEVDVRARRFADVLATRLEMPQSGRFASLAVPADGADLPWKVTLSSPRPVSVCGLASA